MFDQFIAWVKTIPGQIKSAIGNISLRGVVSGLNPFGGGDEVDGKRASGGSVRAGGTYLVGEKGPELFSPGRSGMISPNQAYAAARAGSAAAGSSAGRGDVYVNNSNVFNITGVSDPSAAADIAASRLGATTKAAFESAYSD